MANIRQLKEGDDVTVFYPQTHLKAVIDSEGNTLDEILENLEPGGSTDAVKYTPQTLTTAQKAQARTNIGAAAAAALTALETAIAAKYTKPSSGIPETDLTANVQSALALARTSIQSLADYYDKTEIDSLLAAVSSEQYVDVATLPTASASTLGKIYLVGPTNGVYNRYYTSYDGTTYSWVGVGTTEISLSNYATKAELNQLDQEVDENATVTNVSEDAVSLELNNGYFIGSSGSLTASSLYAYSTPVFVEAGCIIRVKTRTQNVVAAIAIKRAVNEPVFQIGVMGTDQNKVNEYTYITTYPCFVTCCGMIAGGFAMAIRKSQASIDARRDNVQISELSSKTINLIRLQDRTETRGGVTIQTLRTGRVKITGTSTLVGGRLYRMCVPFTLPAGVYTFFCKGDFVPYLAQDANPNTYYTSGSTFTLATATDMYFTINFVNGKTYDVDTLVELYENGIAQEVAPALSFMDVVARRDIESIEKSLALAWSEKELTPTYRNGYFINSSGSLVNSSVGSVGRLTNPISVKAGQRIIFVSRAFSSIAVLCRTNETGTIHYPLIIGRDVSGQRAATVNAVYSFDFYEDCYIEISALNEDPAFIKLLTPTYGMLKTVGELASNASSMDSINLVASFDNVVCVGDSLTWSQVWTGASSVRQARRTYPQIIGELSGNNTDLLGLPGDTASACWSANGSKIVAKDNALAIIYLGTNGGLTDSLDTDVVGDDPSAWANNNTGDYCRFVQKFQSLGYSVLLVIPWAGTSVKVTKDAIEHIGARFNVAVMDAPYTEDTIYHLYPDRSGLNALHYNDLGYAWFASKLIQEIGRMPSEQMRLLLR